jgi:hypothetical protein|tara:strand:- start:1961 stop:2347 length:387 start_codon:yes stop_codon:yes gene_type:complete
MKIFCYSCGSKIEFPAAKKPKFCMNCGAALDPNDSTAKATIQEPEEYEDSGDESYSGNLNELSFDFTPDPKNSIKFEDAIGSNSQGQTDSMDASIEGPQMTEEQFKTQWEKEAGSIRKQPPSDGNEKR